MEGLFLRPVFFCAKWRGVRVVEGARLESVYSGNAIAGSNPALSAKEITKSLLSKYFVVFRTNGAFSSHQFFTTANTYTDFQGEIIVFVNNCCCVLITRTHCSNIGGWDNIVFHS